jgi:uncharacterized membrane protein YhaH (DUF805 family)
MPKRAARNTNRLFPHLRRLRGRHIAAIWILLSLLIVVTTNLSPDAHHTLIQWLITVPLATIAIVILALWTAAQN